MGHHNCAILSRSEDKNVSGFRRCNVAVGRVSRVSPVQTATRNCTRDGGGPFGVGNQVPISSHRKLPLSKAMVVSVAEAGTGRHG
jgi:hypothetical protein